MRLLHLPRPSGGDVSTRGPVTNADRKRRMRAAAKRAAKTRSKRICPECGRGQATTRAVDELGGFVFVSCRYCPYEKGYYL